MLFLKIICPRYGSRSPTLLWSLLAHGFKTWNSESLSWEYGPRPAIQRRTGFLVSSSHMDSLPVYCRRMHVSTIDRSTCFSSNSAYLTCTKQVLSAKLRKKAFTCLVYLWKMQAGAALKSASSSHSSVKWTRRCQLSTFSLIIQRLSRTTKRNRCTKMTNRTSISAQSIRQTNEQVCCQRQESRPTLYFVLSCHAHLK